MKKVFRIILLVLAVIAVPVSLFTLYKGILGLIDCIRLGKLYEELLIEVMPAQIGIIFSSLCTSLFAIIYVVFTLKNGFAKTLYSSVALTIEDLKAEREQREKERRKERISELEETLEQLKQEESE